MTWVFNQSTGELTDPTGTIVAKGYAGGNCGKNPEGVNNPDMQDVSCVGPLPRGDYVFAQLVENHPHLGPYVILLDPSPDNEMYGRSSFRMHGDSVSHPGAASEGCIIMPRPVRELCWHSEMHNLTVVR